LAAPQAPPDPADVLLAPHAPPDPTDVGEIRFVSIAPQAPPDPADVALREALDRRDAAFQQYLAQRDPAAGADRRGAGAAPEAPAAVGAGPSRWESDVELAARLNAADAALLAALGARGNLDISSAAASAASAGLVSSQGQGQGSGQGSATLGPAGDLLAGRASSSRPGSNANHTGAPAPDSYETDAQLAARLNAADAAFVAALNARSAGAERQALGWCCLCCWL